MMSSTVATRHTELHGLAANRLPAMQTFETTRALAEHMGKSVSTAADRPGAAGCRAVVGLRPGLAARAVSKPIHVHAGGRRRGCMQRQSPPLRNVPLLTLVKPHVLISRLTLSWSGPLVDVRCQALGSTQRALAAEPSHRSAGRTATQAGVTVTAGMSMAGSASRPPDQAGDRRAVTAFAWTAGSSAVPHSAEPMSPPAGRCDIMVLSIRQSSRSSGTSHSSHACC